jgi:hypothetical protein
MVRRFKLGFVFVLFLMCTACYHETGGPSDFMMNQMLFYSFLVRNWWWIVIAVVLYFYFTRNKS